jgi:hypothetical protein
VALAPNKWKTLDIAGGTSGESEVLASSDTVCFIDEKQDVQVDDTDTTEEENARRKEGPGTIFVGCTDLAIFNKMNHRRIVP